MIKPLISLRLALGLFTGIAASALLSDSALAQVGVGAKPAYSFRESPTNSMGITSLEDLKGKPVLIEFWGTR